MKKGTRRIPLTQGKFAIVDSCDYEWLMQWKWRALESIRARNKSVWYAGRHMGNRTLQMHESIARILKFPKGECDHKDHNGLNNQRSNLRPCTHSQNGWNRCKGNGYSSKYKGVSWSKERKLWQASIQCNKVRYHIGRFKAELQAHRAYCKFAIRLFGEFARTK